MAKIVDILMPTDNQEGTTSMIGQWLKKPGDKVKQHEPILEISTDKATVEVPSPETGVLREVLKNPNDKVEPGMLLGRIEVLASSDSSTTSLSSGEAPNRSISETTAADTSKLAPAVRRLLEEHGLNPAIIPASGRSGRITHQDVLDYLAKSKASTGSGMSSSQIPSHFVPHDAMRIRIAEHMAESMRIAPHVTSIFECDLSNVVSMREKHKSEFETKGVKLTYTAFFVAAAVKALKTVPEVNSRWHADKLEIFEDINIGVGTALDDKGLVVPVVHRAQTLDLFGIAQKLHQLTEKARAGKIEPNDVKNGTFTISNHGVSGSLVATPIIINQPQTAILGIGKLEKRPKVITSSGRDELQIRPTAYVTLTIDHRALDAFQTNRFLSVFVEALEVFETIS